MSLNATPMKITQAGTVTIYSMGKCRVVCEGFSASGASCRDVSALAMVWAIGELQRELLATLEQPGGGAVGVA